jgi:tetratricopeptide (TPR) repeat protein
MRKLNKAKKSVQSLHKISRYFFLAIGLVLSLMILSCEETDTTRFLENVLQFERRQYSGQEVSEREIEDLKKDIEEYLPIVEERTIAAGNLSLAYKLLAEEHRYLGMFQIALDYYELAIEIDTQNPILYSAAAVAAGQVAKSRPNDDEELEYLEISRRYYEQALAFEPQLWDALFGLAVLELFEFENLEAGKELVIRLQEINPDNTRVLFLAARVAILEDNLDTAMAIYGRIAEITTDENEKMEALSNQQALESGI